MRPGRNTTKREKKQPHVRNTQLHPVCGLAKTGEITTGYCGAFISLDMLCRNPRYSLQVSAPKLDNGGCDSSLLFAPKRMWSITEITDATYKVGVKDMYDFGHVGAKGM